MKRYSENTESSSTAMKHCLQNPNFKLYVRLCASLWQLPRTATIGTYEKNTISKPIALLEHSKSLNHRFDFDNTKISTVQTNLSERLFQEVIHIRTVNSVKDTENFQIYVSYYCLERKQRSILVIFCVLLTYLLKFILFSVSIENSQLFLFFPVVTQLYKVEVEVIAAARGCTAILKCSMPNHVKDLVRIISWVQEPSMFIYPSLQGGKCRFIVDFWKPADSGSVYRKFRIYRSELFSTAIFLNRIIWSWWGQRWNFEPPQTHDHPFEGVF